MPLFRSAAPVQTQAPTGIKPEWSTLSTTELANPLQNFGADPAFAAMQDPNGWAPVGRPNTIVGPVTLSKKTNPDGSKLLRREGFAKGLTPEEVATTWVDIETETKWSTVGVAESVMVDNAPGQMSFYQVVKVPRWTFQPDVFTVADATLCKTEDGRFIYNSKTAAPENYTKGENMVRQRWPKAKAPKHCASSFQFIPEDGGTRIIGISQVDLGIRLPNKIENWVMSKFAATAITDVSAEAARRAGKKLTA